jgi:hypothetical protein
MPPISIRHFDWPRFWAKQDGTISLADGGYLVEPSREASWRGATDLRTLPELSGMRALALLGEPGMGKSFALGVEAERLRTAAESTATVLHTDLRAFSSDHLLYKKVFEDPQLQSWKAGSGELILMLDSLDEALLRIETVAALIADELQTLPADRLSIRVACRTVTWQAVSQTLMPVFKRLWGEGSAEAFEIAPLRREDVRTAAAQWPVDVDAFMDQVRIANAVPFAIKPLTLGLLLRLFEEHGRLPDRIADLYRQGCLSLCEEQSGNRRAAGRVGQLTPIERIAVAGRIAAVSMLANRYAIWTGAESAPTPEQDVALATLATGSEPVAGRSLDLSRDALIETLDTGLFSSRGDDQIGWAHQSFAEFLAAEHLIRRKVAPRNVLDVLLHPSGGLVPQLGMVAAWAASLDPDIRRELIGREPVMLLHGDLAGWEAGDLGALTTALLRRLDEKAAHDFAFGLGDRYRKLAHPGLVTTLRPYIRDATRGVVVRRVAMRIAEACSLKDLQEDLFAVAFDGSEDAHIRACAVSALSTCGEEGERPRLKPLALDTPGPDPQNEIKGAALRILWRKHLDASELFDHLTPPLESYYGAYSAFLSRELPPSLTRDDLPAALGWATNFVETTNRHDNLTLRKFADAILSLGWAHITDAEITPLVVRYAHVAMAKFYDLLLDPIRDDRDAFRKRAAEDDAGRRTFLAAVLRTPHGETFAFSLMRSGLLLAQDFDWLISLGPGGSAEASDIDEGVLFPFVRAAANLESEAHFAVLYDAAERWPLLRSKYAWLLDGVLLDSPAAAELKELHALSTEHDSAPLVEPPPSERVQQCLERFEGGDVDAWWQMNAELTLEPDSRHYGSWLEYRITELPGWKAADDPTRTRIVRSALRFLELASPKLDEWIGLSTSDYSDLGAFRALCLLKDVDPSAYQALTPELWRKWAPLTVAVPQETGTDESTFHEAITADASAMAASEIAEAVRTIIRRGRAARQKADPTKPQVSVLPVMGQITPPLMTPQLADVLLAELADEANTPDEYVAILKPLLAAGSAEAREIALQLFDPWPCVQEKRPLALAAAAALVELSAPAVWAKLSAVFDGDTEFGREVILKTSRFYDLDGGFFAGLSDDELGDFFIWLSKAFPHAEDPVRGDGAHWMSPRDSVIHLRDGVWNMLAQRGTPQGVAAMRKAIASLPEVPWLAFRLVDADQFMRQRTWMPLTPAEVLKLIERHDGRLVQSPAQLADLLVEVLRQYERELHGEQSPVRALWDRQGSGKTLRPVEEDAISDHVKLFLQRELIERGVIVNREVEVGRAPGAPVGKRTDIRVNAIRRTAGAASFDEISAVIESKGCWNAELTTAMETQLKDDYLARIGAPVGIYLVGWFDKPKWDPTDFRRGKTPAWTVADAQQRLDVQAESLSRGFIVRAVVLDCHAP